MRDPFKDKINALPKETKQQIMNLLFDDHLNVGQICDALNLEVGVVAGVIVRQIRCAQFLEKKIND